MIIMTLARNSHFPEEIEYSEKNSDDIYEYRHMLLPKDIYKNFQRSGKDLMGNN